MPASDCSRSVGFPRDSPVSATVTEVSADLRRDLAQFRREWEAIYRALVQPTWSDDATHYPATLWCLVMGVFSRIDLYSLLWDGGERVRKGQTERMVEFLQTYLQRDPIVDRLAIQLFRHTLMHTSQPRTIRHSNTSKLFSYNLQWESGHLPRENHWRLVDGFHVEYGLEYLIEDLDLGLNRLLSEAERSDELVKRIEKGWEVIFDQSGKLLS